MTCPICQDTRHVPGDGGRFRRCECFIESKVRRLLVERGYPEEWAALRVERVAEVLGADNPLVEGLRLFLTGRQRATHFYAPMGEPRHAVFAVALRGLLAAHGTVNVYDTADLAIEYFKKDARREFRVDRGPIILTLGREMEKKVGAFYLHYLVTKALGWRVPIALFTDYDTGGMTSEYFGFADLMRTGGFQSYRVPA